MTSLTPSASQWRKSTHSGGTGGECIELAALPGQLLIRDSKDSEGPVLSLTAREARALICRIRELAP
jgi:hypothetical protein